MKCLRKRRYSVVVRARCGPRTDVSNTGLVHQLCTDQRDFCDRPAGYRHNQKLWVCRDLQNPVWWQEECWISISAFSKGAPAHVASWCLGFRTRTPRILSYTCMVTTLSTQSCGSMFNSTRHSAFGIAATPALPDTIFRTWPLPCLKAGQPSRRR